MKKCCSTNIYLLIKYPETTIQPTVATAPANGQAGRQAVQPKKEGVQNKKLRDGKFIGLT